MTDQGDMIDNPVTGETIVFLKRAGDTDGQLLQMELLLEVDARVLEHVHPRQEERIEVVYGTLRFRLGGEEQELGAGQALVLPPGVPHTLWNVGEGQARCLFDVRPALKTEAAFVGFAGFNPEAALLYRQLRDAGYRGLFGAGDAAASVGGFVEPVGAQAAEGVLFAGCPVLLPEDFRVELRNVLGHEPEASTFLGQVADATTTLLNAVAQMAQEQPDGSLTIDPAALRDAVRSSLLEQGISGSVAFDEHGDRVPGPGDTLSDVIEAALATGDNGLFLDLGLVPCQVQGGRLVNAFGPGA